MELKIKFLIALGIMLIYIFKPWKKKVPFYVNDEKTPVDIVEYYIGLLRLQGVTLSPQVITDAYYTQRFKMINNREPGDASLEELEAAKEYLINRCLFEGCPN